MNDNKPEWGGAPQSSDTGRPAWGGKPQSSDTGRPAWGGKPQSSDTGRPAWGGKPQSSDTGAPDTRGIGNVPEYPVFVIEGLLYRVVRVIASHSGEAKIFEIEREGKHFALKLYRPGITPNHDVLEKVKNLRGNGMLIDIYAHGVWRDDTTRIAHDYEIMEYCSGGSLADIKPSKDEKMMKEYAAKMAAALDFAHSNGILHRDVKPANFLFTDETRSRFVLTDWGLAKLLDSKGRAVTDSGRTKIYAAPEMYTYIEGRPTYVNAKADFFSMGMTLLALWMGEGLLLADETQLVKSKQEEMLPYPAKGEMSAHTLSLIKALTRRNPDVRAGFDDVVRWAKGEMIYKDNTAEDAIKDFRIVFSAKDNLIAHSPKELAKMMWENKELAKKYLYGHTLKEWLANAEQPELSVAMRDIVEISCPKNQDAGLFAACLALNPETVYEGLDGKPLVTQKDIAHELYRHAEAYQKTLYNKKEHPLYAYLEKKGLGDRLPEFRKLIRNLRAAGVRAIAYMLDPDLPFKFDLSGLGFLAADHQEVNSLKELAQYLADQSVSPYLLFYQDDFLIWLANREPELAGKAKLIAQNTAYDNNYKCDLILYTILPDVGFDFRPIGESQRVTPHHIAKKFMEKIEQGDEQWFSNYVDNFSSSPLHAYLVARNKYGKQISWIKYCLEMDSPDNKKKTGPYNLRIAHMKAAAGLYDGHIPNPTAFSLEDSIIDAIPLNVGGHTLQSPEDVGRTGLYSFSKEDQTLVADWLTLFFQEMPDADYKAKSYFKRTAEYYKFIRQTLPGCDYALKSDAKAAEIKTAQTAYKSSLSQLKLSRWLVILLGILPLALAIAGGFYILLTKGSVEMGDTMASIGTWAGIIIGVIAGLGITGETGNILTGGVCGVGIFIVLKVGLIFIAPAVPWIILAFFLFQLVFSGVMALASSVPHTTYSINNMGIEEMALREEMAEAFGTRNLLIGPNISSNAAEGAYKKDSGINKKLRSSLLKKLVWLIVVNAGAIAFCIWVYEKSGTMPEAAAPSSPAALLSGKFSGDVKGTAATIEFKSEGEALEGKMQINYRSETTRQTMRATDAAAWPVVMTRTDNPKITLTIDTAYVESGKTRAKGTYLNSKGNRQPVEIHKN